MTSETSDFDTPARRATSVMVGLPIWSFEAKGNASRRHSLDARRQCDVASNTLRANASTIFDLKTLKAVGEAKTGENPDEVHYDPATHRVFAFNGKSGDVTVIDAKDGKVVGTIALGGKPELAASDGKGTVFVNLE